MASTARRIVEDIASPIGVEALFTIIPTKELAFAKKIEASEIEPNPDYAQLISAEYRNIEKLRDEIDKIEGATYVDVVGPLQDAVRSHHRLYPTNADGHPLSGGYQVIGEAIAAEIAQRIPSAPKGLVLLKQKDNTYSPFFIDSDGLWAVASEKQADNLGIKAGLVTRVSERDLAGIPIAGVRPSMGIETEIAK